MQENRYHIQYFTARAVSVPRERVAAPGAPGAAAGHADAGRERRVQHDAGAGHARREIHSGHRADRLAVQHHLLGPHAAPRAQRLPRAVRVRVHPPLGRPALAHAVATAHTSCTYEYTAHAQLSTEHSHSCHNSIIPLALALMLKYSLATAAAMLLTRYATQAERNGEPCEEPARPQLRVRAHNTLVSSSANYQQLEVLHMSF